MAPGPGRPSASRQAGVNLLALDRETDLGHGVPAVETAFKAADWRAIYKLQLGHGAPRRGNNARPAW